MIGITRQVGTVNAVDADRAQTRVCLPEYGSLRTDWLNVLQCNTQDSKNHWPPDVRGQVEVLLGANGEDDVILDAVCSNVDKSPFSDKNIRETRLADGAEYSYNRKTHTLIIRGSIERIVIECGADVVLKAQKATIGAPETELTGNLHAGGKLVYEGGMTGSGDESATATIHGSIEIKGNAHTTDSMLSDGESSSRHSH